MTMHGPQYLEERRKGIGGSDIAAVVFILIPVLTK